MVELQLIHNCDHKVRNTIPTVAVATVIRRSAAYDDIGLNNVQLIAKIISGGVELSPEIYNLYKNRVVWNTALSNALMASRTIPAEGATYSVTLKYIDATLGIYTLENCPRCESVGWYINPVEFDVGIVPAVGSILVAQTFLKALLTTPESNRLDGNFGAGLVPESGIRYFNNDLEAGIYTAVATAEANTREVLLRRTTSDADELLDYAHVEAMEADTSIGRIYVTIRLVTLAGSNVRLTTTA